jgi:hypothetical protein
MLPRDRDLTKLLPCVLLEPSPICDRLSLTFVHRMMRLVWFRPWVPCTTAIARWSAPL